MSFVRTVFTTVREKKYYCLVSLHIKMPVSNKIEKNRFLKESPTRKNKNVAGSI
jgi:hypothetical protein